MKASRAPHLDTRHVRNAQLLRHHSHRIVLRAGCSGSVDIPPLGSRPGCRSRQEIQAVGRKRARRTSDGVGVQLAALLLAGEDVLITAGSNVMICAILLTSRSRPSVGNPTQTEAHETPTGITLGWNGRRHVDHLAAERDSARESLSDASPLDRLRRVAVRPRRPTHQLDGDVDGGSPCRAITRSLPPDTANILSSLAKILAPPFSASIHGRSPATSTG